MAPALRLLLVLAVAACGAVAGAAAGGRVDLWPMPASVSRGARTLYVAKDLRLSTAGSAYADRKAILAGAFTRMLAVVQMDHAINGSYAGLPVLAGVKVAVHSLDDEV
jgi:hexosaminidase